MRRAIAGLGITAVLLTSALLARGQKPRDALNPPAKVRKPAMADTIKANIYADNWFILYINGEFVAVDSIKFIPHNVISVDLLPTYPMTIAVMAKDNADPKTGMEYANTNIGDGGFILKFGDGTVTDARWKAKAFSRGPIDRDTKNPRVENTPIPENWYAVDFDDSGWGQAKEYSEEQVGPKTAVLRARLRRREVHLERRHRARQHGDLPPQGREPARWQVSTRLLESEQPGARPAQEQEADAETGGALNQLEHI